MPSGSECFFCMKTVKGHFKRHVGTHDKSHKEEEVFEMHRLVANFLADPSHHQMAAPFKQAIVKAGGLSTLEIKDRIPHAYNGPYLFPANQCRNAAITDEQIFNNALDDFKIDKTKVYSVNKPEAPENPPMLADVVHQLYRPDPANAKYAMNVGCGRWVKRPTFLDDELTKSGMQSTCNITPPGTLTDLHIDQGNHVVTALGLGCVKIWALYPPTEHNLAVWKKYRNSRNIFRDSVEELEDGKVCVQTTDRAIYLGPGCLHTTYTLKGGIVPGINYTTENCLDVIMELIQTEVDYFQRLAPADIQPLLETLILCLAPASGKRDKALEAVCKVLKMGQLKKQLKDHTELYKEMKAEVETETDCSHCGKRWRSHWS